MWSSSYSQKVYGLTKEKIWNCWSDINHWHLWQDDLDYARLYNSFKVGSKFYFKPKNGRIITLLLVEVMARQSFTDMLKLPLAKMYDHHELIEHPDHIEIKTTTSITGVFSWVWRKLIVEKIANDHEHHTLSMIEFLKKQQ